MYGCINEVRNRAKIKPLSGLNSEEFKDAVKDERAMELCFEGLRRWDLIRWGEFHSKMLDMINNSVNFKLIEVESFAFSLARRPILGLSFFLFSITFTFEVMKIRV